MISLEQYEIYSEKYNIRGILNHIFDKTSIEFIYNKDYYNRPVDREWPDDEGDDAIVALGIKAMEEYLEEIFAGEVRVEKVRLYNWYVEEVEEKGEKYIRAKGNVVGHYRFWDSQNIFTSEIESIDVLEESGEVVICTKNTRYFCLLDSWNYEAQDKHPDAFPNYMELKEKYDARKVRPTIEPGKVLLSISNYDSYYFHDLYFVPEGAEAPVEYKAFPHIGTFQDSFLIWAQDEKIDLRYFPHSGNIEFYMQETDRKPFFIENAGTTVLYARTSFGTIKLNPGERKEVKPEEAEKDDLLLDGSDLYAADILE